MNNNFFPGILLAPVVPIYGVALHAGIAVAGATIVDFIAFAEVGIEFLDAGTVEDVSVWLYCYDAECGLLIILFHWSFI